jgi:predicted RNase H-like HicB family nuclease
MTLQQRFFFEASRMISYDNVIYYSQKRIKVGELMKLKVVLEPSDEGGYTVYVPSLPGCISEGDTREEALANIREAIELYLEPTEDDQIPQEKAEVLELAL